MDSLIVSHYAAIALVLFIAKQNRTAWFWIIATAAWSFGSYIHEMFFLRLGG